MEFQDTDEDPRGRHRIAPDPGLISAVADSAKRGKSKIIVLAQGQVDDIRRQLRASEIRDRYAVVTKSRRNEDGSVRFIFKAQPVKTHKDAVPAA